MSKLSGYKTYMACLAAVAYAAGGWYTGDVAQPEALNLIFEAVVATFIRHGIASK